jgi:hypothetical protein
VFQRLNVTTLDTTQLQRIRRLRIAFLKVFDFVGIVGATNSIVIRACPTVRPYKFILEYSMKAERARRGIALLFV